MKTLPALVCLCAASISLLSGCKEKKDNSIRPITPAKYTGKVDTSVVPIHIDLEETLSKPKAPLKLSQIASEIDYYIVGDANYTVTQAIAIPDSNAFLTFNNPRLYYRKTGKPSKRYGFKALAYKWNNEMNGHNLFYDKKTSRMYCALSGKDQNNKEKQEVFNPQIGVLPPLDTMLTINRYVFPEMLENKYTVNLRNDKLLGFSSNGYMLSHYEDSTGLPNCLMTFSLEGETLCKFQLKEKSTLSQEQTKDIPFFQTSYWNDTQDRMTFMIPFCDTVYQLRDPQTVVPLYTLHFGQHGILSDYEVGKEVKDGKIWLRTLYENPKGLFMGMYQKKGPKLLSWLRFEYEYKPTLSYQAVYLKEENKTHILPEREQGFINDLDGGLTFWPDGQTDEYLYMILTLTEMRLNVKRTGSPQQQKLIDLLDNTKIQENQYVMIVVR